jgi:hypothetical protein
MVTLRIRSVMWFAAGIVIAIALVWTTLAWRAFAAPGPGESTIVSVTPVRVLDTRDPVNVGLAGPFLSTISQDLQVTGSVPTTTGAQTVVPAGATGVLLNVTVTGPTLGGFLSVRPADAPGTPTTSSLNFATGQTVPNAVQVNVPTAGPDAGKIEITYNADEVLGPRTDVLIDIVGYTTNAGINDLVASIAAKADPPKLTKFSYSGETNVVPPGGDFVKMRDLGTFTKASASTVARVVWASHVLSTGATRTCSFQIRVDGVNAAGSSSSSSFDGTEATVYGTTPAVPASVDAAFAGLSAGSHTVSLWARANGVGGNNCTDNDGNFTRSVTVEEYAVAGGVVSAALTEPATGESANGD